MGVTQSTIIKLGEVNTVNTESVLKVTNDDEIKRNGILEYIVVITDDSGSAPIPGTGPSNRGIIKVIGINPGTQDIKYNYGLPGWPSSSSVTVTVEPGAELSACYPGSREYNFFRDVFKFLRRDDLWENFWRAVDDSTRGMIDWSRVWGRPMGYIGSLRELLRLLYQARQNGRPTGIFLPQIREVIENRERDIRRHLRRDPGHNAAARYWRLFEVAMLVVASFGVILLSDGTATPEVLAFLEGQGVTWEEIAGFLSFLRKRIR